MATENLQQMISQARSCLDRIDNFLGYGQHQASMAGASAGTTTRTRRRASARRRTSTAHLPAQPVAVGTQAVGTQKPKRHLSRAARAKLSAAAKHRWAQRKGQQAA